MARQPKTQQIKTSGRGKARRIFSRVRATGLSIPGYTYPNLKYKEDRLSYPVSKEWKEKAPKEKLLETYDRFVSRIQWMRNGDMVQWNENEAYFVGRRCRGRRPGVAYKVNLGTFFGVPDKDCGVTQAKCQWRKQSRGSGYTPTAKYIVVVNSDIMRGGVYSMPEVISRLRRFAVGAEPSRGPSRFGIWYNSGAQPTVSSVASRLDKIMRKPDFS